MRASEHLARAVRSGFYRRRFRAVERKPLDDAAPLALPKLRVVGSNPIARSSYSRGRRLFFRGIAGLSISPINYFNSGFECASVPDVPTRALCTFTVVDLESASAALMMVSQGTYAVSVAPTRARLSAIVSPGIDYSCYVRILNKSGQPLTLSGQSVKQGYWAVSPPQTIPAGGRGDAWLQDYPWLLDGSVVPHGTDGGFTYQGAGEFKGELPDGLVERRRRGRRELRRAHRGG